MADKQAQVPGSVFYNDVAEATLYQRQVPGGVYVNETQQTAAGGFTAVNRRSTGARVGSRSYY